MSYVMFWGGFFVVGGQGPLLTFVDLSEGKEEVCPQHLRGKTVLLLNSENDELDVSLSRFRGHPKGWEPYPASPTRDDLSAGGKRSIQRR
jgi:hypothetical protein